MSYQLIRYATEGPLAWLSLNRPDKLNAINAAMVAELHDALDRAEADTTVRVILLSGEGRAFSSGFDLDVGLEEEADAGVDGNGLKDAMRRELTRDFDIIMRFWDCPKPTIAAVHTYCLGSAMEMAVACDITLAANDQLAVRLTKQAINRGLETAGMRQALLDALETDVEIESTETEESRRFKQIMKTEGARAAIAWRSAQLR